MLNKLKSLLESLLDETQFIGEETVKVDFPWKRWTLNKETAPLFMKAYRKRDKPLSKFSYEPDGISLKHVSKEDGSGTWQWVEATQFNTPSTKSIISLDYDNERFFLETNLSDPRIAYILKSTFEVFPELSNFKISKIKWNEENPYNKVDFEDFGTVQELMSKMKTSKGTFSTYKSVREDDEEDRFEEFEFLVFKELTEETWYHATRQSTVNSIMKKGILPSKTFGQGTGWTQFNLSLQNAVYITTDLEYAANIAMTLTTRFNENAAIIAIDGKALQDFSKIVADEDSLRNEYHDGLDPVQGFSKDNFSSYTERMPEVIESVVHKINSIGYKGIIEPQYLSVEEIIEAEVEDNGELKESTKRRNTKNFLAVLNYKSKNNIK